MFGHENWAFSVETIFVQCTAQWSAVKLAPSRSHVGSLEKAFFRDPEDVVGLQKDQGLG